MPSYRLARAEVLVPSRLVGTCLILFAHSMLFQCILKRFETVFKWF
jgi:hypothetical protein